jgi:hypothetical protein
LGFLQRRFFKILLYTYKENQCPNIQIVKFNKKVIIFQIAHKKEPKMIILPQSGAKERKNIPKESQKQHN